MEVEVGNNGCFDVFEGSYLGDRVGFADTKFSRTF